MEEEFDYTDRFRNGLARVRKGKKWGIINENHNIVVPVEYDSVWKFWDKTFNYRNMQQFKTLEWKDRHTLEFWLTANGLSYGKALDDNGEFEFKSRNPINPTLSRRVEFRIVTTGDEVLENFVNQNQ